MTLTECRSELCVKLEVLFSVQQVLDLFDRLNIKINRKSKVSDEEFELLYDLVLTNNSPHNDSKNPFIYDVFRSYRNLNFEALKKERAKVSRKLNQHQSSSDLAKCHAKQIALEIREDVLERAAISSELKKGTLFKLCSICGKYKPIVDDFYGYHFTGGRYRAACKRCKRESVRSYHAENPEVGRDRARKHQEYRNTLGDRLSNEEKQRIRISQKDQCAYCGMMLDGQGEFDHYYPADSGGGNMAGNRVVACHTCNRNKGRKTPGEFLEYRGANKLKIRTGGFYNPSKHDK